MSKIRDYYFIPSAFNDRRLWTACKDGKWNVAYFPYFDPALTLDLALAQNKISVSEPELDPAFIFKVLGDTTRYAIASVIARSPKSAVELTKILSVSKSTMSQHVSQLRQAGLIDEQYIEGSVRISLRRTSLEQLSSIVVQYLFNDTEAKILLKTRRKI